MFFAFNLPIICVTEMVGGSKLRILVMPIAPFLHVAQLRNKNLTDETTKVNGYTMF